ncbi:MAG: hypothetical protein R3293_16540 [Candidatus Promineifilaceae bacterium]|nr:hypothetical protein [Candidatus Promineifilaceae bacterium]
MNSKNKKEDFVSGSKEESVIQEKANQAQQKAAEVANEAQQQAAVLAEQAKVEAKSSLETQKEIAARELHGVASALRQTGSTLSEQDQTMFAQYSNRFADQVEQASSYLEEHDLEDLVQEAEDFARRQPELFIGGAFTLGLLAARFLKSSAPGNRKTNLPARPRTTAVTHAAPAGTGRYPYERSATRPRSGHDYTETL